MNIISLIQKDIATIETSREKLRQFVYLVGPIALGIGFLMWYRGQGIGWINGAFLAFGTLILVLGLIHVSLVRPLYLAWMSIAVVLGFFVFRLLLVIVYSGGIVPIGLMKQWLGAGRKESYLDPRLKTYWTPVDAKANDPARAEHPF